MISAVLLSAAIAAHPFGSASVNQLVELAVFPDRVEAVAVVDLAELPTLQLTPSCDDVAGALTVKVGGEPVRWSIQSRQSEKAEGAAGLPTSRVTCHLSAPAGVRSSTEVLVDNRHLAGRTGWQEITARGEGVALDTGLPTRSSTNLLRDYPTDPLTSPKDIRTVSFTARPGADAVREGAAIAEDTSLLRRAERWLTGVIGDLTPKLGMLAVALSLLLGAAHAALPGHGKTVIAVYLAGRQGRRRDALLVGATVTLSHTAGVLVLGLGLTALASLAAESVLSWLGIVSGAIVVAVGAGMLIGEIRHRHAHSHGHSHDHRHHHHHHHHHHERKSLTALGVAGGLVPSPTALVVLLGAVALGRTWFGVLLTLAYGLGMAATLSAAGLALITLREKWEWLGRLTVPATATGSLIVVLGLGLAARAAFGI